MEILNIGFDAKRAACNRTGLGNYSRNLIAALCEVDACGEAEREAGSGAGAGGGVSTAASGEPAAGKAGGRRLRLNLFSAVCEEKNLDAYKALLHKTLSPKSCVKEICETKPKRHFLSFIWRSFGICRDIKRSKIDVYHGLSAELPFGIKKTKAKSVVTIHDLIFLRHPEFFPKIDRLFYYIKSKYACKTADKIIAVSERTKQDIVEYFGTDPNKIEVVYQSCSNIFSKEIAAEKLEEVAKKYSLPQKFMLFVGSIEERKNLMLAAKALSLLDESVNLVAVGKRTPYTKKVEDFAAKNAISKRLFILNSVEGEELAAIYKLASVFVYPSLYEGFGIPIIEAISAGVPVVAASGSCLEEAGGEACKYVSPFSEKELAEAVTAILGSENLRQEMINKSYIHIQKFFSGDMALKILDIYDKIRF